MALEVLVALVVGSSGGGPEDPVPPTDVKPMTEALKQETGFSENTKVQDKNGNTLTVPSGFKIATKEDDDTIVYTDENSPTVQDGIVIQDVTNGNQFVWIPVGTIKKEGGEADITIELARYRFDVNHNYLGGAITGTGKATLVQKIEDYDKSDNDETNEPYRIYIDNNSYVDEYSYYYYESTVGSSINKPAKSLEDFKNGVSKNGGYYLARFEASESSGTAKSVKGVDPWGMITQPDASAKSQSMYNDESKGYQSDLVNSYAWDTAITFIQKCLKDEAYAKETAESISSNIGKTGEYEDRKCNICDMAGNVQEWSTETTDSSATQRVCRGAYYGQNVNLYTSGRYGTSIQVGKFTRVGFRPILYVK